MPPSSREQSVGDSDHQPGQGEERKFAGAVDVDVAGWERGAPARAMARTIEECRITLTGTAITLAASPAPGDPANDYDAVHRGCGVIVVAFGDFVDSY